MTLNQTLQLLHKDVIIARLKSLKVIFCLLFFNLLMPNTYVNLLLFFFPFKKLLPHKIIGVISLLTPFISSHQNWTLGRDIHNWKYPVDKFFYGKP